MIDQEEIKLVFEGSSIDADFVTNILKDSGISTLVKNKNIGNLFPHHEIHGDFHPVKIFVKNSDFENARGIVEAYFEGRK